MLASAINNTILIPLKNESKFMTAFPQTNQNKIDRLDKPPAETFHAVSAKFIAATHCKSRENRGQLFKEKTEEKL